ncbi:MAG: bacillithiol system redox-active protein YtxJ [bacterium]|nr:bacillithiol system redox-active protein YtxJ [bacterium]
MKLYFKHSTRCPISAGAKVEMDGFLENNRSGGEFNYDYELVDVISNRPRSSEVAEQLGVRHESPQLIIADDNNNVLWSASHYSITEESIKKAVAENM